MNECTIDCIRCYTASLDETDANHLVNCIKLDMDCAEICRLTVSFLLRNSDHANHLLAECSEICDACATECEKHDHMVHYKRCAESCRKCATACMEAIQEKNIAL